MSQWSPPIRSPSVPVREAVFLVFNVDIPPVSQPSGDSRRHSGHSCGFPPPASLPYTWRTWRTLRETFFYPSAWARQDAAPPEVAQDLLNKHRVTSGGAACCRAAGLKIMENRWFSAGFRFPESSRTGRPRPHPPPAFPSVPRSPPGWGGAPCKDFFACSSFVFNWLEKSSCEQGARPECWKKFSGARMAHRRCGNGLGGCYRAPKTGRTECPASRLQWDQSIL